MNEEEDPTITQQQMLLEILENSRQTKNYMKWQLIITVALVVLPILAVAIILPMVLSSVGAAYGVGEGNDLLQGLK